MRVLDLFSGIGRFSLGLERAGFETVAFCEIDPFCRRVLAKHWPGVPCYDDVRTLTRARLGADGVASVDVICGGFPCQDISLANRSAEGIAGARSGLWSEIHRLTREFRPRVVFLENVSALLGRGIDRVLADLASFGYDAEWHCIPAGYAGSIQNRDRVWIVAYPAEDGVQGLLQGLDFSAARQGRACGQADLPDVFADPFGGDRWPQPLVRGGRRGFPDWAHRVGASGNSVDPAIPEAIGRAILSAFERAGVGENGLKVVGEADPVVSNHVRAIVSINEQHPAFPLVGMGGEEAVHLCGEHNREDGVNVGRGLEDNLLPILNADGVPCGNEVPSASADDGGFNLASVHAGQFARGESLEQAA